MYLVDAHASEPYLSKDDSKRIRRTCFCGDCDTIVCQFDASRAFEEIRSYTKAYRRDDNIPTPKCFAELCLKESLITQDQFDQLAKEYRWKR